MIHRPGPETAGPASGSKSGKRPESGTCISHGDLRSGKLWLGPISVSIWRLQRWGRTMREVLQQYVKRVQELAEHVRGNEQATKQSLVGPLFMILGYDLTDPRECIPEHRVDFGPNRSVKPIDWAFLQNGHPIFFVE